VEILLRLSGRALGVLEEGHLRLVPAPCPRSGEADPTVRLDRRAAPDRDMPALVVAVARLWSDVRAGQRDIDAFGHGQPGRGSERRTAGRRVDGGLERDAHRISI